MSNLGVKPAGKGHLFGLNWERVFLVCLGILPYFMVASLGGMLVFMGVCLVQRPKAIFKRLFQSGLAWVALLLILSTLQAQYIGEASLQLLNFLPYFLLWSAIAGFLSRHHQPWRLVEQWAWVLVIGSLPASLFSGLEYVLKRISTTAFATLLQALPPLDWVYTGLASDPRAYGPFDSPNTLANYAVMVLGLALGLLMNALATSPTQASAKKRQYALGLSVVGLLMALYCSGSRNGYLIAVVLVLSGLFTFKTQRWIRWGGLAVIGAIAASALTFGIGGRQISWAWVTDDPRVYVWRLALRLTRESPWLGNGLGNYKLLYDGSVPGYSEMPHAHNLWLSLAAEAGILTTLCLTVVVGLICYRALRQQRSQGQFSNLAVVRGYYLSFMAVTLFSLFDVTLYDGRINLLSWFSLAIIYASGHRLNEALKS
jgi:O-antigen ligase